jgi:hypothetical protein
MGGSDVGSPFDDDGEETSVDLGGVEGGGEGEGGWAADARREKSPLRGLEADLVGVEVDGDDVVVAVGDETVRWREAAESCVEGEDEDEDDDGVTFDADLVRPFVFRESNIH